LGVLNENISQKEVLLGDFQNFYTDNSLDSDLVIHFPVNEY